MLFQFPSGIISLFPKKKPTWSLWKTLIFQFPSGIISLFRYAKNTDMRVIYNDIFQFPSGIISLFHGYARHLPDCF